MKIDLVLNDQHVAQESLDGDAQYGELERLARAMVAGESDGEEEVEEENQEEDEFVVVDSFQMKYFDNEHDLVVIASQQDLEEALAVAAELKQDTLRVFVLTPPFVARNGQVVESVQVEAGERPVPKTLQQIQNALEVCMREQPRAVHEDLYASFALVLCKADGIDKSDDELRAMGARLRRAVLQDEEREVQLDEEEKNKNNEEEEEEEQGVSVEPQQQELKHDGDDDDNDNDNDDDDDDDDDDEADALTIVLRKDGDKNKSKPPQLTYNEKVALVQQIVQLPAPAMEKLTAFLIERGCMSAEADEVELSIDDLPPAVLVELRDRLREWNPVNQQAENNVKAKNNNDRNDGKDEELENKLSQLAAMGFGKNRERCVQLLREYDGNVQAVLNVLLFNEQ